LDFSVNVGVLVVVFLNGITVTLGCLQILKQGL